MLPRLGSKSGSGRRKLIFMFINFATVKPRPGREQELADLMKAFRDALQLMPGVVGVYVLCEEATGALARLSIWRDKASFEAGMVNVAGLPAHAPEDLRKAPPLVRQFVEI
jgi:heme-degrading monooxygenase HmoA